MSTPTPPIAIIGGGPIGLTASLLLSQRNIPHTLYSRHPSTAIHPKAVGINQRAMEIFRSLGLESAIYAAASPPHQCGHATWYTGFGENGRFIAARDMCGGGDLRAMTRPYSPCEWAILPQITLEPILLQAAQKANPGGMKFGHDVLGLREEEGEEGAHTVLQVLDRASGKEEDVKVRYAIGADGGRTVTDALGIGWDGEKNVFGSVTAHFKAPGLRKELKDQSGMLHFFIDPAVEGGFGSGFMYHLGPYPIDPATEEWAFICAVRPGDPTWYDEETMTARLRRAFKLPDLKVEVLGLSHWKINAINAKRYRSEKGSVFLVGDAAHRIPPFGALGLNTGVSDVFNLVWKLDYVLNGLQKEDLLDTYEKERQPVGARVGATSIKTVRTHGGMERALGLSPTQSDEVNISNMEAYFDTTSPDHETRKADVAAALKYLDRHFKTPGAELGCFYPSLDKFGDGEESRQDGQILEDGEFDLCNYHPSTIPGHNLPHAWVKKGDRVVSTRDLMPLRKNLMVVQKREPWYERFHGDKIEVVVIGEEGEYEDVKGVWPGLCGTGIDGAVLATPDGVVVARAKDIKEWDERYTQGN